MKLVRNFIFIVILLFLNNISLYAAKSPITPGRLAIVGGIIGGVELVNGLLQLFKGGKEKDEMRIDRSKQKEIDKLLSGSRLLSVLNEESNIQPQQVVNTNEKITETVDEKKIVLVNTNSNIVVENKKESKPMKDKLAVVPSEQKEYFTYKITSYTYKKSKYLKKGVIDYYEVGVAYYNVNKKEKAREYLLHTIAIGVRKEEAIDFLIENFNMTRKEIQIEKKKYRELK